MSNNFDGPILFDDISTYLGWGRTGFQTDSTGPRIYTRDLDPSVAGLAAPIGSLCLRRTVGLVSVYQKTTAPDTGWVALGGGGGSTATQYAFVWRPGGATVGNVYANFSDLNAAASVIAGQKLVLVDTTLSGGTATFDALSSGASLQQYDFLAQAVAAPSLRPTVVVPVGVTLTGLPKANFGIVWNFNGGFVDLPSVFFIQMTGSEIRSNVGGSGIRDNGAPVGGVFLIPYTQVGTPGGGGGLEWLFLTNAGTFVSVSAANGTKVLDNSFSDGGLPGASINIDAGDAGVEISRTQPNFTAANISISFQADYANIEATQQLIIGSGPLFATTATLLVNPAGGVTITLPTLASMSDGTGGKRVKIQNYTTSNDPITLVPAGGEVIQGGASYVFNTAPGGFASVEIEATAFGAGWLVS
jgi:hypothetical protein